MQTFRILMTKTTLGKDDDPTASVVEYAEGNEYSVGPDLFRAFVDELGVAEAVAEKKVARTVAPKNKAAARASNRKNK